MGGKRSQKRSKTNKTNRAVQPAVPETVSTGINSDQNGATSLNPIFEWSEMKNVIDSLKAQTNVTGTNAVSRALTSDNIKQLEIIKDTYEKLTLQMDSASTNCNAEFLQKLASDITAFHVLICSFMRRNRSEMPHPNSLDIEELNKLQQENKELEKNVQELTDVYNSLKDDILCTEKAMK